MNCLIDEIAVHSDSYHNDSSANMNQHCPFLESVKPRLTHVNPEETMNQYPGHSAQIGKNEPEARKPENQVVKAKGSNKLTSNGKKELFAKKLKIFQ